MKKKKKGIAIFFSVLTVTMLLTVQAFAYGSQGMSYDFNTGSNGNAYLDGSKNGCYYSLSSGNVHLDYNNQSGTGDLSMTLYRSVWYGGAGYGTVTRSVSPNSSYTNYWKVDTDSSKYYLKIMGTGVYSNYTGDGTMYDY